MTPVEAFRAALAGDLAERERAHGRRRLRLPAGIDLVSNDYLGYADDPRLRRALAEAPGPAGAGGSRLLRGHHQAFADAETRLARFSGTPAALLFATGYAANVGLLQALIGRDDLVVSDERNHASLIDGLRLTGAARVIHPHLDTAAVEHHLRTPRRGRAFVVTESVFSMDGDLCPLPELVDVAERHGALVIVDEAHATGLYGSRGSGRVEELGLRDRVLATVHTGGKALGLAGAWVAASAEVVDTALNRARTFIFSTAPLPALAGALCAAADLVEAEPERRAEVRRKSRLLRAALAAGGLPGGADDSPIVPVVAGENERALALEAALQAEGFDVRAVRPPTVPAGTARLRVSVRHPVADADLLRFAHAAARAGVKVTA